VGTFERWAARAVDVDVDGLRVAAHDEGDGPVVTFLHGYPSSSLDVIPLLDRLGGVRVVAPDLPGFGASDKPADPRLFHPRCRRRGRSRVAPSGGHLDDADRDRHVTRAKFTSA
jgi:pimeloyl-ACP methyl ester carboxylesterase